MNEKLARKILTMLDNKVLVAKDNKLLISGKYAWKMKEEKGIPPEILEGIVNSYLNE